MKTVLIVDDTVDYTDNLKIILSQAGYNVIVASSGNEGLEKAVSSKPDLILMDLLMPQQDGVETTIRIKEQGSLKDVPIIFLTAAIAGGDVITSVDSKNFPTISKMVNPEKLLGNIRECIGG